MELELKVACGCGNQRKYMVDSVSAKFKYFNLTESIDDDNFCAKPIEDDCLAIHCQYCGEVVRLI